MAVTKDVSIRFPCRFSGTGTSPPGYGPPTPLTLTKVFVATRSRTGQRLPHYRRVIQEGGNATTPLSATWDTVSYSRGLTNLTIWYASNPSEKWTEKVEGDVVLRNGRYDRVPLNPTQDTSYADNQARAKFYKKLRQIRTSFSAPTFLGELRETLHMLRRPAAALWSNADGYLSALKKRKRESPRHWTKSISGLWLEHSFGWLPLLRDIEEAYKAYNRIGETKRRMLVSASFKAEYDRSRDVVNLGENASGIYFDHSRYYCDARLYEEVIVRYRGAVDAQVGTTEWDNMDLFGLNPKEFIPTAWELLPWSFLVDYFTNIGDILEASVVDTSNVAYVNRSVICRTRSFSAGDVKLDGPASIKTYSSSALGTYSGSFGAFELTRKTVLRSAGVGISLPRFQFDFDLSRGQLGNIAALLGSARALHPQNPRPLSAYLRPRRG